jgi:hypothetical protein
VGQAKNARSDLSGVISDLFKFCLLGDREAIVQQVRAHGHHVVTATTLQGDPGCIIEVANFCGLAEEDIDSYDPADPILTAINTLRAVLPTEGQATVNSTVRRP